MKKYGFTMVELIFVIVILGILAAVAVPKLNASREDAQVATILANARTLYNDIHAYYLAQGEIKLNQDLREATNLPLTQDTNNANNYYFNDDGKKCFQVRAQSANCVVFWWFINGSEACKKALEKADLVGLNSRENSICSPNNKTMVAIKDAKLGTYNSTVDSRAIDLRFDRGGIEWE